MTWVIVFIGVGVAALVAIAVCALPLWREGRALVKQVGRASESFNTSFEPLGEALERLGEAQGSSPRR
jgi:predicted PurR-regulated permease PerM